LNHNDAANEDARVAISRILRALRVFVVVIVVSSWY
jgi:hypothetical protein